MTGNHFLDIILASAITAMFTLIVGCILVYYRYRLTNQKKYITTDECSICPSKGFNITIEDLKNDLKEYIGAVDKRVQALSDHFIEHLKGVTR